MEFCRIQFGKQIGLFGSVVALAPTASAANSIQGWTWHSAVNMGLIKSSKLNEPTTSTKIQIGKKFHGVRLIIIDEISMVNANDLYIMSERIKKGLMTLTIDENERSYINSHAFGGISVIFAGDFYQLQPIQKPSLFKPITQYHK